MSLGVPVPKTEAIDRTNLWFRFLVLMNKDEGGEGARDHLPVPIWVGHPFGTVHSLKKIGQT